MSLRASRVSGHQPAVVVLAAGLGGGRHRLELHDELRRGVARGGRRRSRGMFFSPACRHGRCQRRFAAVAQQRSCEQAAEPRRVLKRFDGTPGVGGDRRRQSRRHAAGLVDHGAPVVETAVLVPVGIVDERIPLSGAAPRSRRRAVRSALAFAASTAAKAAARWGSVSMTPSGPSRSASSRSAPSSPPASVLSALRMELLGPFPLASPARFSRSLQRAWLSFAPSPCRMSLGQYQDIHRTDPEGRSTLGFDIT